MDGEGNRRNICVRVGGEEGGLQVLVLLSPRSFCAWTVKFWL